MVTEVAARPKISARVQRLKDSLLSLERPISCERLQFVMDSYRETEGQPPVIRRARLLAKVLSEMTIFIDENPIVGSQTKYRGGVQPYPEWACRWMKKEPQFFGSLGTMKISPQDQALVEETIDYWQDKSAIDRVKEIWAEKHPDINVDDYRSAGAWADVVGAPMGRMCVDYGKVLNKGLEGIMAEARAHLDRLPIATRDGLEKREFLNAVILSCQAVAKFARRYAALARDMAGEETNPFRKEELELIAGTCDRVPAKPARSFREAVQSFWFTHVSLLIEHVSWGFSPGRFPLYMYPFYKADKEAGRITEEEALELLELLFIKFTEVAPLWSRVGFEQAMANMFQNISLGGVTADGKDATNELDYLMIEAQSRVRLMQPTLSILYHDNLPDDFLLKAADLVKTGIGMPAFFNNDLNIQAFLAMGTSLEDARNHCIIGCVERGLSHTCNTSNNSFFSMPKMLEFALYDGKDPKTGKQLGAHTGDPDSFQSYGQLFEAVKKQMEHSFPYYVELEETHYAFNSEYLPVTFTSALVDDCIQKGEEVYNGGSRYSMNGYSPVGVVDLADSLAAIKKLVFEEKRLTLADLKVALEADFEGYEQVHRLLLDAPKYGNDDEYVDSITRACYDMFYDEHARYRDYQGRPMSPPALSVTGHFRLGVRCGATPNGRKARIPFTDASVSASPGMDRNGPTALIRSATRVIDTVKYAAAQINMKFHPTSLSSRDGLRKLLTLVKTYLDLGGHHIQFNVVSTET
ncbi:MAG TPA: pyruvate formate lyase family protein, partial [Dehalococcoidia bacterium]|nr:pyruvate formate lyase family protein [Dehalococcoidia bacterium]